MIRSIDLVAAARAAKALLQPPQTRLTGQASCRRPHSAGVTCPDHRSPPPPPPSPSQPGEPFVPDLECGGLLNQLQPAA